MPGFRSARFSWLLFVPSCGLPGNRFALALLVHPALGSCMDINKRYVMGRAHAQQAPATLGDAWVVPGQGECWGRDTRSPPGAHTERRLGSRLCTRGVRGRDSSPNFAVRMFSEVRGRHDTPPSLRTHQRGTGRRRRRVPEDLSSCVIDVNGRSSKTSLMEVDVPSSGAWGRRWPE